MSPHFENRYASISNIYSILLSLPGGECPFGFMKVNTAAACGEYQSINQSINETKSRPRSFDLFFTWNRPFSTAINSINQLFRLMKYGMHIFQLRTWPITETRGSFRRCTAPSVTFATPWHRARQRGWLTAWQEAVIHRAVCFWITKRMKGHCGWWISESRKTSLDYW